MDATTATPQEIEHSQEEEALFAKYPHFRKVFETGIESHDGRESALLTHIFIHPSLPLFPSNPLLLLSAIDDFSHSTDFLISIGPHKSSILTSLLIPNTTKTKTKTTPPPKTVLELGGYLGYSAILFAHTLISAHGGDASASGIHIYSLELSPSFASIARQLIDLAGLTPYITVIEGSASTTLPLLSTTLSTLIPPLNHIDVLFLDHSEPLYVPDTKLCLSLNLLHPGSTVIADNVVRPGAPEYRAFMRSLPGWRSEGVRGLIQPGDFEDELEVSYFER